MADTGWLNPSSTKTVGWANANNAVSENSVYASCSISKNSTSSAIVVTTFNIGNIITNSSSTINGIEVRIKRYASNTNSLSDGRIDLILLEATTGQNKAVSTTWGTSNAFSQIYGGSTDMWGTALTYGNVIDPTFGISFSVTNSASGSRTAYVDVIQMKIYYTAPVEYYVSTNTNITSNPTWNATPKLKYVDKVDSTLLLI